MAPVTSSLRLTVLVLACMLSCTIALRPEPVDLITAEAAPVMSHFELEEAPTGAGRRLQEQVLPDPK